MTEFTDRRGIPLKAGQYIAYGKSDRYDPLNTGIIVSITDTYIEVRGDGNVKTGKLNVSGLRNLQSRIVVLPDEYLVIDKLTS